MFEQDLRPSTSPPQPGTSGRTLTLQRESPGAATFPSGVRLRVVSGSTGRGEEHWDPHGTGLPLYATGPDVRLLRLSPSFTVKELVSSGGTAADRARIDPRLVTCLQAIRDAAGKPVTITSGYRSWARNVQVYARRGKQPTLSRHCSGQAADIKVPGMTGLEIARLAISVCGERIGVGVGADFAHVDVRGTRARWTYFSGERNEQALAELDARRPEHRRRRRRGGSTSSRRPTGSRAAAQSTNLVLVSGGPGLFDNRDVEHDQSWANYVTPPLLLTDTAAKRKTFTGTATDVTWFVYRPAYSARFADDAARGRASAKDAVRQGFANYEELLEHRAKNRGWRLRWFTSADDLWSRMGTFRDPVVKVVYWGHARDDLWFSLAHSSSSTAMMPTDPGAVLTVASIAAHAGLRRLFGSGAPHRFVGCNTAAFAAEWNKVFGVAVEGVDGKVDFSAIHRTGGEPSLVAPGSWKSFAARARQRTP